MIQGVFLAACEFYLLGLLIAHQEYLIFEILIFSQAWLLISLIPFHLRGETKIEQPRASGVGVIIFLLAAAVAGGVIFGLENFWSEASNFGLESSKLLSQYADLLPVAAVAVIVSALGASSLLRGNVR